MDICTPPASPKRGPYVAACALSEAVAEAVAEFDIVYFQDLANSAFTLARRKRFTDDFRPVLVTVLHGPGEWARAAARRYPISASDLEENYVERYAAEHSDWVVSPSRYMQTWLEQRGWRFRGDRVRTVGVPVVWNPPPVAAARTSPVRRILYLGRWDTASGSDTFSAALARIAGTHPEVTIISPRASEESVRGAPFRVKGRAGLKHEEWVRLLARHVGDSLCVFPPMADCAHFPYSLIEACMVGGLRLIASRTGGIPEILGEGGDRLFDPFPQPLAKALTAVFEGAGPAPAPVYDIASANRRWLNLHGEALDSRRPGRLFSVPSPAVDVCVACAREQAGFPRLVEALERQTGVEFTVTAVDTSPPGAQTAAVSNGIAERHQTSGWRFLTEPGLSAGAAWNRAAARGRAEFLLIADANDLPETNAIARMLECIRRTGDDCLVVGSRPLPGDGDREFLPLGPCLTAAILDPDILGSPMMLVRRSAFEASHGFRELPDAGREELQIRLGLAGYRLDVIPEFLAHAPASVPGSRSLLLETYEEALSRRGAPGAAKALLGMACEAESVTARMNDLPYRRRIDNASFRRLKYNHLEISRVDFRRRIYLLLRGCYRAALPLQTRYWLHDFVMGVLDRLRSVRA